MKNSRLKILHVGPLPPPVGGMATVVANLSEALSASCELRVLNNRKQTQINRTLLQGITSQLSLLGQLLYLCLKWSPDIVHVHTCSWLSFWRSSIDVGLSRLMRRKVILHIHGAQFHRFLDSLSPIKASLARLTFQQCKSVVVLGNHWKTIIDSWCDSTRVVVVPNGVPIQTPRPLDPSIPFTIICLANYEKRKGQSDLLKAAAALNVGRNELLVALLGFESEAGQHDFLIKTSANLGLEECTEIPGPVTGVEKEAWWSRADCLCLPSYDEGLPMSVLEAMAQGIPVVTTNVGAIPEVLEHDKDALIFPPGDVDMLTRHLQSLMDDPHRAKSIGMAGREKLIRSFSIESSVDLLLRIYRDKNT